MVLSGKKKTSSVSSLINQNTGGGSKKAGFPYQIGRSWRTSLALDTCSPRTFSSHQCCTLKQLMITRNPNVCPSRPLGRNYNLSYWKCNGLPK